MMQPAAVPVAPAQPEKSVPRRPELRFRRLSAVDLESAVAVFERGFGDHELWGPALGLDRTSFGEYFKALIALALVDKRAAVLGAECQGALDAVLIASRPDFPTLWGGLRFLREFARAAGWAGLIQYLRFSHDWERFMRRPTSERKLECRGLWLAADRSASGRREQTAHLVLRTLRLPCRCRAPVSRRAGGAAGTLVVRTGSTSTRTMAS